MMRLNKKHLIYAGVGLFVFLVLVNSTKKVALKEVTDDSVNQKSGFDSSKLPPNLKPPYKMADGDIMPRPIKKNLSLNGIGKKPRFDNKNVFF